MAYQTSAMLDITRASDGRWTIAPKVGRDWLPPAKVDPIFSVFGSETLSGDFDGVKASNHRFQASIGVQNTHGYDGMDGMLRAFMDEVDVLDWFWFQWPQEEGTEFEGASPRKSGKGEIGDNSVTLLAGIPPKVGRIVKFGTQGKAHRVSYAPATTQTSPYQIGITPSLIDSVAAGTTLTVKRTTTPARFIAKPQMTLVDAVMTRATLVVRETRPRGW